MQIFLNQGLAFLAVPKTGSTAYEAALRPFAAIDVKAPPRARHITARRFDKRWRPFVKGTWGVELQTIAVLRDPLDRMKSWYRYRSAPERRNTVTGMTFDQFLEAVLSETPPPAARIGAQDSFVSSRAGDVIVTHLFAIEVPDPLDDFLSGTIGSAIVPERVNVSPAADVRLSKATERRFRQERAAEFALYERVRTAGHVVTERTAEGR